MSIVINGTLADDLLIASEGDDVIFGEAGNDLIFGGDGNDVIFGGAGTDVLIGGDGNDFIFGGSSDVANDGQDVLLGGAGDDFLAGGDGTQLLIGGDGSDTFASRIGEGVDIVADFEAGIDQIAIQGGSSSDTVAYDAQTGLVTVNGEAFMQLDAGLDIDGSDFLLA